jgi:regulator of sirC expression with transglutaminase-like and TPR domain
MSGSQPEFERLYLRQILSQKVGDADSPKLRLDRAVLELATIQFPDLEIEACLDRLNELASHLGDRLRNFNDGREFVEKAQQYLFDELGFHGNETDYFDPLNSCLNQVLERRTGIPVSLSVMYMEIARRLAMPVYGIGLPRHFIIQFDDGNYAAYIDPFHGGRAVSPRDILILSGAAEPNSPLVPAMLPSILRRVTKKEIAMRMLRNLQRDYIARRDWARALETVHLLILGIGSPGGALDQELAAAHKLRSTLHLELNHYSAARADLEMYLRILPDAPDTEDVRLQVEAIHRRLARLN